MWKKKAELFVFVLNNKQSYYIFCIIVLIIIIVCVKYSSIEILLE